MKNIILTSALLSLFIFASCKKTRTCSCDVASTSTTTTVPRNGGPTIVDVSTSTNKSEDTYSKIKKDEMKRLQGCVDNTSTSITTYTTSDFTGSVTIIYDVTTEQVDVSTCTIK